MGYRVIDQRQTFNMGSGARLAKVWELTVDTDEGPSYMVDVPMNVYGNTDAVKQLLDQQYAAFQAVHSLKG